MQKNRTNIIIGASFLALVALFAFQTKWMTDSRNLIEQQFNQKVNLALCYAVNLLGSEEGLASCGSGESNTCLPIQEFDDIFQLETKQEVDMNTIENALDIALRFYHIDMDYEVAVVEEEKLGFEARPKYSCALNPLQKNERNLLIVDFPDKAAFIFSKVKFMFFSSIILLGFLTLVFLWSGYTMFRQRKMYQINKEFFNNMAHEFRTPLTNISLAGTLLSKNRKEPKEERYLTVLKEESGKLSKQVDKILLLSKMENGEYQLVKERFCLKKLINHVVQGMELQIKEKNATINFNVANENVSFEGDKFHLENAFRNLLENALKYSKHSPEVNIALKRNDDGVMIHFEDNGIGISKKDQKEVFEKYYRVNQGNIHDQKGFGLGLAYVKMIIERHKGFIKIFSDLNKGTRFDLFLPASN